MARFLRFVSAWFYPFWFVRTEPDEGAWAFLAYLGLHAAAAAAVLALDVPDPRYMEPLGGRLGFALFVLACSLFIPSAAPFGLAYAAVVSPESIVDSFFWILALAAVLAVPVLVLFAGTRARRRPRAARALCALCGLVCASYNFALLWLIGGEVVAGAAGG